MKNKSLVDLFLHAGVLKNIKRYGWVLKGVEDAESISDHAFRVTFMAIVLSEDKTLNRQKIIDMALIHDLGKAIVGDVIYQHGKKNLAPLKNKYKDEKRALTSVIKSTKNKKYFLSLWDERVEQKTKEAKFIKSIEKLEMIITALEYEMRGYKSPLFDEFWENAGPHLKSKDFIDLFKELERRRRKLR